MSSSEEKFETLSARAAPLVVAGQLLAERGVYGLVWIDEDLIVSATFGRLVNFVLIGEPVVHSLPALAGLERAIADLRSRVGDVLDLPAVRIVDAAASTPRLNLTIFWSQLECRYLLAASRSTSQSELEADLVRTMRARLIAEAELSAKSRALERANADLEAFATIISHDLKAPMRALRYRLDDLERVLPSGVRSAAHDHLDVLRIQSRRVAQMLDALLEYSSLGHKSQAVADTDTRALVDGVIASLGIGKGFHVSVEGEWPVMPTLAAPLDLVLRNLIDNAVKHHDRDIGRVRVGARLDDAHLVITIEDDGPGIRPEYHEAAFQPFCKLNDARNLPGVGMGLALVRRTVEGLGGRLELRSAAPQQRGTVFTVYWPHLKLV